MTQFLKLPDFRLVVSTVHRRFSKYRCPSNSNLNNLLLKMPKEPKHIVEAQKQRIKIKQKSSKYAPGRVTLQILGTGAKGAPRSVYLFSDQSRYLFNCGEGTQRLAHEHKTKLAKLEHIFITQSVWKNIGGLPGTALTIQDVGVPEITLHGPTGLNEIFPATKRFVVLRDLRIKMADCSENTEFEDNVMKVKYVVLSKAKVLDEVENGNVHQDVQATVEQNEAATSTRSARRRSRTRSKSMSNELIEEDNTDYYAHERKRSRRRSRSRSRSLNPDDKSKAQSTSNEGTVSESILKGFKDKQPSICYICRLQPRPGALNLDKCVRKGVPPGPLLGLLKTGQDITLKDGTVVKSSEVCEPDDPGPVFLVVDCPAPEYLDSLVNNEELRKHQKFATTNEDAACLIVHFSPKEVMEHPLYINWMDDFPASTEHLPVNEMNSCTGSIAVHRIQHKLNLLSSEIFPLLGDKGIPHLSEEPEIHQSKKLKSEDVDISKLKLNSDSLKYNKLDSSRRHLGTLSSYHLRPKKGFDINSHIKLDIEEFISETTAQPEFPQTLKELHNNLEAASSNLEVREFPKILFLGTGSCIPNKTRNTSAILLQTSTSSNILLDCGEGTCGQISRFFGPDKSDEVLCNLDAIYISHLHADHHIGLIGLLQGRRRALDRLNKDKEPLYLFAPKQILSWLMFYDRFFESINEEFLLIPNGHLIVDQVSYDKNKLSKVLTDLNLCDISTCFVRHCPNAFGVAITHKSGYKITYSGDTMPSENLINLGENSDVLIHEATMEDELSGEAVTKMHSTTSQAIQVGKDMGAKNIILTHFSQRYAKLPRFNDNFADNVSIAFDNMLVKLDHLPLVPLLYPALKIMFAEHYEELENKAVKRQLRSELQASMLSS